MGHYRKQMVSVLLTTRCNLACTYCITSCNHYQDFDIDPRFARRGISDYFEQAGQPYLRFTAVGEPTQRLDLLKELHAHALEISGGRARFELQSNGTFDEEAARWIADNIQVVWLSFEGLPEVQDQLKPTRAGHPSSARVLRNLELMQRRTFVGFRATITTLNVHRQREMIRFAADHGVKAIFSKIMLPPSNPAEDHTFHAAARELCTDIMTYARAFIPAWELSRELGVFYGNGYINNFDEDCFIACRTCAPCPHLLPDGHVSACDRATLGTTPLQEFIYGRYDAGRDAIDYDQDKMYRLRARTVDNMPGCAECPIKYRCAGGCLGTTAQHTGDIVGVDEAYCEAIKYMFECIDWDPRDGLFPYFMT